MHYLAIFRQQFNQTIIKFLISTLEFVKLKTVIQNKKKLNLGPKKLYLGLLVGKLKTNCHICNQRPPICLMAKFCAKIRILKIRFKNDLFLCFGQQFGKNIVIFAISTL